VVGSVKAMRLSGLVTKKSSGKRKEAPGCRCGSTTHLCITSKFCPLNKKCRKDETTPTVASAPAVVAVDTLGEPAVPNEKETGLTPSMADSPEVGNIDDVGEMPVADSTEQENAVLEDFVRHDPCALDTIIFIHVPWIQTT
jgi:hypothetical protein